MRLFEGMANGQVGIDLVAVAATGASCSDMSNTGERLHNGTWTLLGDPRS